MSHFCADPGHLELRLGRADLVGRLQAVPEPAPRGAEGRIGVPRMPMPMG
jgi:hypothetical protein